MKTYSLTLILALMSIHFLSAQSEALIKKNSNGLTKLEFTNNNDNVLIGVNAGSALSTGTGNTLIGNYTGLSLTSGTSNTLVGMGAGNVSSGVGNVALGFNAGQSSTGNGNIFLGTTAGLSAGAKNNSLWITNQVGDSTRAIIYGEMGDMQNLRFNASTDIFSNSVTDFGLFVEKNHQGFSDFAAIKGENIQTDYYGIGVEGVGGWRGVSGIVAGNGGGYYSGVFGNSDGINNGINYGVHGEATGGATNYGIYGKVFAGTNNYAGYFDGKLRVNGIAGDPLALLVKDESGVDLISATKTEVVVKDLKSTGTTEIEIVNGKKINQATSMKYYIAVEGTFPTGGPISNDVFLGEIRLFPYTFGFPGGWRECNGDLLDISTNSALFSLIGDSYGGDGVTNFALPDMREAIPHHSF